MIRNSCGNVFGSRGPAGPLELRNTRDGTGAWGRRKPLLDVVVVEAVVFIQTLPYPRRHLAHGLGPQVHAVPFVLSAKDVLPPCGRLLGEVLTVMGATRLLARE